jgi:Rrf2 family transcriptional regulator, nitric oxide-sensitive transcriptional repressor
MRLTRFTDNALRSLTYLALHPSETPTVGEVASRMGMSEDHLLKVVQRMSQHGFVQTVRGRKGGMRLAKPADQIVVGAVVRSTEDNLELMPCFDADDVTCPIATACTLSRVFDDALHAFLSTLDRYTIADLVVSRRDALMHLTGSSAEKGASGAEAPVL